MTPILKNIKERIKESVKVAIIALAITLGVTYAFAAWVGPTATPPNNNVDAPINVGAIDQIKDGGLGVDSLAVFGNGAFSGYVQIGDSTEVCEASIDGSLRFNVTNKCLQLCSDSNWKDVSCGIVIPTETFYPGGTNTYEGLWFSEGTNPGCGPPHTCAGYNRYVNADTFTFTGTVNSTFTILKDSSVTWAMSSGTGCDCNQNSHIWLRLFRDGIEIWSEQVVTPHGSRSSFWNPPAEGYLISIPNDLGEGTHDWYFQADADEASGVWLDFYVKAE